MSESEFVQAYIDGNADKMLEILERRFPDAPENSMAAVVLCIALKAPDAKKLEEREPNLGELVEKIKSAWVQNQW